MPELPDVEGFRRTLAAHAAGHRITAVDVYDTGVLRGTDPQSLSRALTGRRFAEPHRHGKWLVAPTEPDTEDAGRTAADTADGPTVILHFGMTGDLRAAEAHESAHRHDRVVFTLDNGDDGGEGGGAGAGTTQLRYRDMRKLQGIALAGDEGEVGRQLAEVGPDAGDMPRDAFDALLTGRRGAVKTVLTDQRRIAGLGNLLADEILWQARLHPRQQAAALDAGTRRALYRTMRRVLRTSMTAQRVPPRRGWLTGVRDEPEPACPRCGTALVRDAAAGRSTLWCPRCQPEPHG